MVLRNGIGAESSSEPGKGDPERGNCSCPAMETCESGALGRAEYKGSVYKGI